MMKKLLKTAVCLCLGVSLANAQNPWNGTATTWSYDFSASRKASFNNSLFVEKATGGTAYKTDEDVTVVGGDLQSTAATAGWLPTPAGATTIVQARALTAAANYAKYTLVKDGSDIKSLKINGSVTLSQFNLRGIDQTKATPVAKYSFRLKTHFKDGSGNTDVPDFVENYDLVFGYNNPAQSGGNTQGAMFRGINAMGGTVTTQEYGAVFTSFRLSYVKDDASMSVSHRKIVTNYNTTTAANGTAFYAPITNANVTFNADGSDRQIEVYCNNSASTQYYVANNVAVEVASQTAHLWIDGKKIGEYSIADAGQAPIVVDNPLNCFTVSAAGGADVTTTAKLTYGSVEISDISIDYVTSTSSTVPVSLNGFQGKYEDSKIKLNWQTLSEQNNSHFEVLRSADGVSFNEISRIDGKGNSAEVVNYTVTDYNPSQGVNYYKLKQVDYDGEYSESDVIVVNILLINNGLQVMKKGDALGISLFADISSSANLYITDVSGHRLYSQKVQVSAGNNQFNVVVPVLASGVYVLCVEKGGDLLREKFVN